MNDDLYGVCAQCGGGLTNGHQCGPVQLSDETKAALRDMFKKSEQPMLPGMTPPTENSRQEAARFNTVLMDPPWLERGGGKIKRGADRHYPLMKAKDMPDLITGTEEWSQVSTEAAHLWMWVTNNFLRDGLWLMDALGFRYITNVAWVKMRNAKLQIGLGQYLRGSHELLLFGRRGSTMKPAKAPPSVIIAERTRHSAKPKESYELIEQVSPGGYLEYFARSGRKGWAAWGNEAPGSGRTGERL